MAEKIFVDETISDLRPAGRNNLHKLDEFRDMAFGMFVHWSLDSVIGSVISHWMIGCEIKLIDRFVKEMPALFEPKYFCAEDFAYLARQSGMKYLCFTAKHHNGFCMFDTKTTDFNCMNTPYGKDIVSQMVRACRKHGVMPGLYFSPLDFYWQYCHGREIRFKTPEMLPANDAELMQYDLAQVKELLQNYGEIGTFFFDGPPEKLKDIVWDIQPDCIVTRGEMPTPEQIVPETAMDQAWETCHTISASWGYKPYGDALLTPLQIIEKLIEVRAKGGNLLLNLYPDPLGKVPEKFAEILREVGMYLFFNGEAIYRVRPYKVMRENNIWFTRAKDENTVYAFITNEAWDFGVSYGENDDEWSEIWHDVTIKSVEVTDKTEIEIVGQSGRVVEHRPQADVKTKFTADSTGLHIHALLSMRPQDNRQWPYPVVLRITNVII